MHTHTHSHTHQADRHIDIFVYRAILSHTFLLYMDLNLFTITY